jgi:hypothetical protein
MEVGSSSYSVEFTDEPAAPEPTAQTESATSPIDDVLGGGAETEASDTAEPIINLPAPP